MADKILGVVVGSDYVDVAFLEKNGPDNFTLQDDTRLKLQTGERPAAYGVIHRQFLDYVQQREIQYVCIKETALNQRGMTKAHMNAAELRGVILAAASLSDAEVRLFNKSATSRSFGGRKVDEYIVDDSYWDNIGLSD